MGAKLEAYPSPSLEGRGRVKAETRVLISGPAQEIEP